MSADDRELVWISPTPPVASGISQYTRDFLAVVGARWPVSLLPERGGASAAMSGVRTVASYPRGDGYCAIAHVGNSGFHQRAFNLALRKPGITVLHDLVLHHARLADLVRRGKGRDYLRLMENRYGADGRSVAQEVLRGATVDLSAYPLSEDYLESAMLALVHSAYSRERALQISPSSRVAVVPMGIPMPALISRSRARDHLELPRSAFIISSITHVNPLKRIHVVLRALRGVVREVPETILVIAGSVAPGMNLERRVSLLGLERHVRILGYLSDNDARVLARASDVSVNLRYPSTGETSASLLRLLGAQIPVIVTPEGPTRELPDGVALRVPVDRFEEETLTEFLLWLARDDGARQAYGSHARSYVEKNHSMASSINGYRDAIREAFDMDLPPLEYEQVHESEPNLRPAPHTASIPEETTPVEEEVVQALRALRLDMHDGTIQKAAEHVVDLQLHRYGKGIAMTSQQERGISPELLDILACPVCKTKVRLVDEQLLCDTCGRRYRIENGIPIMLVEEAITPKE